MRTKPIDPGGYVGRVLFVNLSTGDIEQQQATASQLRKFVGGYGLGVEVLYGRIPADADPLGPENMLGFVTGPLTGTPALLGTRYAVVGKSPLTGGWGDANSGGEFGPYLKFSGYDAVFFRGVAERPVYLLIDDGKAELRPAEKLWGADATITETELRLRHGDGTRAACIGPAGEKRSLISCIVNDTGRAAGRSGLGAVMGAKNLKAIAAKGGRKPPLANIAALDKLRDKYLARYTEKDSPAQHFRRYGTTGLLKALVEIGRTPLLNFRGSYPTDFGDSDALDGPSHLPFVTSRYACWTCPQACGAIVEWMGSDGPSRGHRPEYETLAALGTYCGIESLTQVMQMNDMCNRAGLDTISAGATIAFAMECYENGILKESDLDGLSLVWGAGVAAIELLQWMIDRRGIGDVLADGVACACGALGKASEEFAMHAGGQEIPAHDPRHLQTLGLQYQISPTPGRHTQGGGLIGELPPAQLEPLGFDPALRETDRLLYDALGYQALTAWINVLNAAGLCVFGMSTMGFMWLPEFLSAVTGWDVDMEECLLTGERIEVMRHIFGLKHGYRPLETAVAARAMGHPPLSDGPTKGVVVDVTELRRKYFEVMEWDEGTAQPSRRRLEVLGLTDVV